MNSYLSTSGTRADFPTELGASGSEFHAGILDTSESTT